MVKPFGGRGFALDPAGGAYSAPPDPLAGGEGDGCPLPNNLTPLSALWALTNIPLHHPGPQSPQDDPPNIRLARGLHSDY